MGYCECIRGVIYTRIADLRRTTGLNCIPENEAAAIRVLDERIEAYLHPERVEIARDDAHPFYSIFEVVNSYSEEKKSHWTDNQKRAMRRATKFYFSKNFDLFFENSVPSQDPIYKRVVARNSEGAIDKETQRKYMLSIRRLLDWAVLHKFIKLNNIRGMEIPKKKRKGEHEKVILSPEMMSKLFEYFTGKYTETGKETFRHYELFFRFLYATGMRGGEALKLKRSDVVAGKVIRIVGKGGVYREFPLSRFPDADEVVVEQLKYEFPNEKFFRWNQLTQPQYWFREARDAKCLPANAVEHSIRASAEWRWENELFLPYDLICDIAGHTPDVRESHYRKKRQAAEMEKAIDNARTPPVPKDNGKDKAGKGEKKGKGGG